MWRVTDGTDAPRLGQARRAEPRRGQVVHRPLHRPFNPHLGSSHDEQSQGNYGDPEAEFIIHHSAFIIAFEPTISNTWTRWLYESAM